MITVNKIIVIALLPLLFLCAASFAHAQTPKVRAIGFLVAGTHSSQLPRLEAFREGLREAGWVEGQNISVDYRYAEGKLERLEQLLAELIRLKPEIIVANGVEATAAAKSATKEIPIVMTNTGEAVALGFVASLARPGGNITGLTTLTLELTGKRLELLKEAVPKVNRVAVIWNPEGPRIEMKPLAQALGLNLQILEVKTRHDIEDAFQAASRERADAHIVSPGAFVNFHRKLIAELAVKNRLPGIAHNADFVEAGSLMSYGVDTPELFRRAAAHYVDRILKGAKPADLPVEQPTKFELLINLKTAKQIGVTIPLQVLARAQRVIR